MGFKIEPISRKVSLKRSSSSRDYVTQDSTKTTIISQTPAPFNSTSFLIRQKCQLRKEQAAQPPVFDMFDDLHVYQYGSNFNNLVACCTFDTNRHDLGCGYKSQADHPAIIGFAHEEHGRAPHHQDYSSTGTSSPSTNQLDDDATSIYRGESRHKRRRTRSVQDDNFALLQANPRWASCRNESVDVNLINHFCGLQI